MKKLLFILAFIVAFFLSSCVVQEDPYVDFDEKAFSAAKEKWASLNSNNYTFTYRIVSTAVSNSKKYHVTVINGESSFTVTDKKGNELQDERIEDRYPTVDSLFKLIQNCYDSDSAFVAEKPKGIYRCELSIDYDEATGIPTRFEHSIWNDGSWKGDGFHMYITDIAVN